MAMSNPLGNASDRTRRRLAWAAPLVVAGAVVAGVMVTGASSSDASPSLPTRTPAQLIAEVLGSNTAHFSGTVSESASLGLPSLPGDSARASLSWQTFVTGTHSARVWVDGPERQRVALLGELSEADAVHDGADVWTYTSDTNTVTHAALPQGRHGTRTSTDPARPDARDLTPSAIADRVLKAIDRTTAVTVDPTQTVDGEDAYTLVVSPHDPRSTVQKVTIAIDAKHHIPLALQIYGAGSSPAFSIGFTDISFGRPAASTFRFVNPSGANVSNDPFGTTRHFGERRHARYAPSPAPSTRPTGTTSVIGSGWTSVVELSGGLPAVGGGMLRDATTSVGSSGDRLLHTALVNVLVRSDGRTFVGAVSPKYLEGVAASAPR
ncbi:MAG TPA: hypothetical protein VGN18_01475 [Jatrophihabitans sp.]|uniref:LolA family protein n=1 Tax=Jatrophihabitans sp. TaxID=1932789 RepID=UPI002E020F83|nr:hypothetical protein [Jatrophihabitans sp.]